MTPNNTHGQHYGRNQKDILPISRFKSYELDEAIKVLCERGYELINRGVHKEPNRRYDGLEKHWARLRKVDNTSETPPSVSYNA